MERSKVCRICMNESAVVLSLFGEDALWRKIVSFANVEIRENDRLPQQICTICARDVLSASSLKLKCEDADKYFRRIAEASGLCSTTTPQLEYTEIEIKNEPIDLCEPISYVTTTTSTPTTSNNLVSINRRSSHKSSAESLNSSGFISPEPSLELGQLQALTHTQTNSPSSSQIKNNHATTTFSAMISIPIHRKSSENPETNEALAEKTIPTMISIPIHRKSSENPETNEAPAEETIPTMISIPIHRKSSENPETNEATTEETIPEQQNTPSLPEKLAPIKLKYSSSTSSAEILSSTTNTNSAADSTILPYSSTPFKKKKRSRMIKKPKSADLVKAKKRIKKIGSLSLNNTTIAAASSTVQPHEPVSSTKIVEGTSKVSPRRQVVAHQCDICGGRFALKNILKHHIRASHPDVETSVQCNTCKRTYASKIFHDRHIRNGLCRKTDETEKAPPPQPKYGYNCPHCRRTFPTGHHLGWHKRRRHCFGLVQERVKKKASGTSIAGENQLQQKSLPPSDAKQPVTAEQLNEGQVSHKKTLSLNHTDNGETSFQWNSPEFNGDGNLKNLLPNSPDNNSKLSGGEKNQYESSRKNESNENVDNNNTNMLLELSDQQQPRSARPQKLPKKLNSSYKPGKTRKPYVYMDDAKFELAKIIVANGGVAADLAKHLNISLITAWRVRQCVVKNVPLKFRRKREGQPNVSGNADDGGLNLSAEGLGISAEAMETFDETLDVENKETDEEFEKDSPKVTSVSTNSRRKKPSNSVKISELSEMVQSPGTSKNEPSKSEKLCESIRKPQKHTNDHLESTGTSDYSEVSEVDLTCQDACSDMAVRRISRAERRQTITTEILSILKEDKSAQYWKISNRLAERGIHMTPPSICRKLRMMGINRRSSIVLPSKNTEDMQHT